MGYVSTPIWDLRYPDGAIGAKPDVAGDIQRLALDTEGALSEIGNARVGTAAARGALTGADLWTGLRWIDSDSTDLLEWIYTGTAWVRYPIVDFSEAVGAFTAATGWAIDAQSAFRIGPLVVVAITYHRSGGSITLPSSGDIVNQTIATFRTGWTPLASGGLPHGGSGPLSANYVQSATGLVLCAVAPYASSIANGDIFSAAGIYTLAS